MIEAINPLRESENLSGNVMPARNKTVSEEAKNEFMALFYKAILNQAFKAPNFSLGGEDEEEKSGFLKAYNSDLMVEQLARELLKNKAFSPDEIMKEIK